MKQINRVLGITIITISILGMLNIVYGGEIGKGLAKSHIMLGLTHIRAAEYIRAHNEFQTAMNLDPGFSFHRTEVAGFYYDLGVIYLYNDRIEESRAIFGTALRLCPEMKPARSALALALTIQAQEALENGRTDEAERLYGQAITVAPDGDPEECFAVIGENCGIMCNIIDMAEDLAGTCCAVGEEYLKAGLYTEAMKYYGTALRISPDSTTARTGMKKAETALALEAPDLITAAR